MAPLTKLFSSRRVLKHSLDVHDSFNSNSSDNLFPSSFPAKAYLHLHKSSAKAWGSVKNRLYKTCIKSRKLSKQAATALKQLSSCISAPSTKDEQFFAPASGLAARSSSSIYFDCEESFSRGGNITLEDGAKGGAGSCPCTLRYKQGASYAQEVQVLVVDECANEMKGGAWDCAPGVERLINTSGLGRLMDGLTMAIDEDDELGDIWG